jgi:hypothetical protein
LSSLVPAGVSKLIKDKAERIAFQNCQPRKRKETENRHQKTSRKLVLFSLSQIHTNSCLQKYTYERKFSSRKLQTPEFERSSERASESDKGPKSQETKNPLREEEEDDDDDDDETTTTSTKAHSFYIARAVTVRNGKISFGDSDENQALSFREHGNPVAVLLVPSRVT